MTAHLIMTHFTFEAEFKKEHQPKNFHLEYTNDIKLAKDQVFEQGLEQTIVALIKAKKHVILVEDIPTLSFMPTACIKRPLRFFPIKCQFDRQKMSESQKTYHSILLSLKQKYPQISIFNAFEVICEGQSCSLIKNNHRSYALTSPLKI